MPAFTGRTRPQKFAALVLTCSGRPWLKTVLVMQTAKNRLGRNPVAVANPKRTELRALSRTSRGPTSSAGSVSRDDLNVNAGSKYAAFSAGTGAAGDAARDNPEADCHA